MNRDISAPMLDMRPNSTSHIATSRRGFHTASALNSHSRSPLCASAGWWVLAAAK
jgi:hypothetical protein